MAGKTTTTPDLATMIADAVAAALAGMAGETTDADDAPKGRKGKTTPKGVGRVSTFHAGVVKRLSIPRRKGATFTYQGKRGATTWKVIAMNADGGIEAQRTK